MFLSRTLPLAFALGVCLVCLSDAGGQTNKNPVAQVTVSGKEAGSISIDIDGKKDRFIFIDLEGGTTIKVRSNQDITTFNAKLLEQHTKLTEDFTDKVKKLIAANDLQGVKKAEQEFKVASDEMLKYLS